jgi:hypothetical protein
MRPDLTLQTYANSDGNHVLMCGACAQEDPFPLCDAWRQTAWRIDIFAPVLCTVCEFKREDANT